MSDCHHPIKSINAKTGEWWCSTCDAAGIDEVCPVDHITLYYAWNIHKMDGKPIKDFSTGEVIGYTDKVDCPHCQQELKKEG